MSPTATSRINPKEPTVFEDNQGAIGIARNKESSLSLSDKAYRYQVSLCESLCERSSREWNCGFEVLSNGRHES